MISRIIEIAKESKRILKKEDELELSYLFSNKINELPHLMNTKRKINGAIVLWLFFLIKTTKLFVFGRVKGENTPQKHQVMIYSGSFNQKNTFSSVIDEIDRDNISYIHYVNGYDLLDKKENEESIRIGFCEYIVFIYLALSRSFSLFRKLDILNKKKEIKFCFDQFLSAYLYVPIFVRLVSEERPKLICISNDHNVDTRVLRSVAEMLKIETLYIQHATVTDQYPPLKFTYSMLDGENALEIYKNIAETNKVDFPNGKMFLSGQKKTYKIDRDLLKKDKIGIAVNTLDEVDEVIDLLEFLTLNNFEFVVRSHPNQDEAFVYSLEKYLSDNYHSRISIAKNESLTTFLSRISILISSNSSIHIEAALNEISTIYYEFGSPNIRDYYNFVAHGISIHATKVNLIHAISECHEGKKERENRIKKYCETYGTKWSGNEGKLVANFISRIILHKNYRDIFALSDPNIEVYRVVD